MTSIYPLMFADRQISASGGGVCARLLLVPTARLYGHRRMADTLWFKSGSEVKKFIILGARVFLVT